MQPRPIAETFSPLLPRIRVFIGFLLLLPIHRNLLVNDGERIPQFLQLSQDFRPVCAQERLSFRDTGVALLDKHRVPLRLFEWHPGGDQFGEQPDAFHILSRVAPMTVLRASDLSEQPDSLIVTQGMDAQARRRRDLLNREKLGFVCHN
jgi:hypothetical protein